MQIVLCLDDRNGIQFNKRRLSSDASLYNRVLENRIGKLWIAPYSAKLFSGKEICIDEKFLEKAEAADTCFVENLDFMNHIEKVTEIKIYRWNRIYPSDIKLPEQALCGWSLIEKTDFPGNSHEMITEEKYVR